MDEDKVRNDGSEDIKLEWLPATVEIRITNADVPNPDYDRRCRRGYRANGTIKAGTRFKVFRQSCQIEGKPDTRKQINSEILMGFDKIMEKLVREVKGNDWKTEEYTNPLWNAIMAHSEPCNDLRAIFALHFEESMSAFEFATKAVEKGWMTIEQVREIVGEK